MDDTNSAAMSLFEGMVLFDPSELSPSLPDPMPSTSSETGAVFSRDSGQSNRENKWKEGREVNPSQASTPNSFALDSAHSVPPAPSSISAPESLNEDLFSNLTLLTPTPGPSHTNSRRELSHGLEKSVLESDANSTATKAAGHTPLASELPGTVDHLYPPSRQMSRKKKRAVRVGYARESTPAATAPPSSPALLNRLEVGEADGYRESAVQNFQIVRQSFDGTSTPTSYHTVKESESPRSSPQALKDYRETSTDPIQDQIHCLSSENEVSAIYQSEMSHDCHEDGSLFGSIEASTEEIDLPEELTPTSDSPRKGDPFLLAEGKFELIRAQVTEKLDRIRSLALSVWAEKKNLVRLLRNASDDINSVSLRLKNLEGELEEACEAEDFERAEKVSQDLAAAEEEKLTCQDKLRQIEYDCESLDSKMEDIFQTLIAVEEEGMLLFRQFAEDSSADADAILRNADEIASKEMQEWHFMSEALDMNRLQTDIELELTSGSKYGLEVFIEQATQKDREEKEELYRRQAILSKELKELLELIRLKEAQIAENRMLIQEAEKKISNVSLGYKDSLKAIQSNFTKLQSTLFTIKQEAEALSSRKQTIGKNHDSAKCKGLKLKEISHASADAARKGSDLVKLRKLLALPILKSREDKLKLTKSEEEILKDVETLKQHIVTSRSVIQELSQNRSRIQEEIASFKQRISFIDIRCPELENEKKAAAAARNFKEAGRIAAEAKALSLEKENFQDKIKKSALDLEKIEEEIDDAYKKIRETKNLILLKEKEAARAEFQKLHLVVAIAKAERLAAVTLGDAENEEDVSLKEVEAAQNRARDLQQAFNFDEMDLDQVSRELFSLSMITCLSGGKLALLASSLNLSVNNDT